MHLAEVEQRKALSSCFSAHTLNKCPFRLSSVFRTVFAFLSCLLFKMVPILLQTVAEVLSGIPEGKKALMCLTEKIRC